MKEGDNENWENRKECPGKEVEVVWACDEKIGALRGKEGDGKESTKKKEEKKAYDKTREHCEG